MLFHSDCVFVASGENYLFGSCHVNGLQVLSHIGFHFLDHFPDCDQMVFKQLALGHVLGVVSLLFFIFSKEASQIDAVVGNFHFDQDSGAQIVVVEVTIGCHVDNVERIPAALEAVLLIRY